MTERDRVDEKEPTELEPESDVVAPEPDEPDERVYDIGSDSPDPVEEAVGAAEDGSTAGEEASSPKKRGRLRFSRREVLDKFQEKNQAITKLAKEKQALEREKALLTSEKTSLESQVKDLKDKWLRSAAEFENYRKRTAKEWELLKQQSRTEVILEILDSVDDFERAFATVDEADESEFVRGIRLIHNNLLQALQRLGVAEIDARSAPFDPSRHMAIGQIETTEVASGHVAEVAQKGYTMNGTVIRPARVVVAK
jgi:molecular chaperone GrpE